MNSLHSGILRICFANCNKNDFVPSFADFITQHSAHIRNNITGDSTISFSGWFSLFKQQARKHGFQNVKKGRAAKVWDTYIVFKKPSAVKRSHNNANVLEALQGFNVHQQEEGQFVFEDYDVGKAMNDFANQSMQHLQQHCNSASRFRDDMNRWLAIHGVLKLNKCIDTDLAGVFCASKMEDLCKHFRIKVFGKPARLNSTLKVEIIDLLSDYDDDRDSKKLKLGLAKIVGREDGAVSRTVESVMMLVNKVTKKKKDFGKKKTEDVLEAVWGSLFRVTDDHDPHRFDNVLFPSPHPLNKCQPDYAVEVSANKNFINEARYWKLA
ncbi:hypothetical protein EDC96DRAFT_594219 [Choanephora cucurbitarum]|nr:hypothetical protein EDC96DRAFT_594219 [Choanephora cucurbitarum]